ncbi:MAG: hypothetical protein ACREYE_06530 [Gammaproteobacteria bacterium]
MTQLTDHADAAASEGAGHARAAAAIAKIFGEAISLGSHRLELRATLRSIVPVDQFEVVGGGEVVALLSLDEGGTTGRAGREIEVERSGWYLLRAWNSEATHPVLDVLPFATTSAIDVTVGGQAPDDADYFIAWIEASAHGRYKTAEEKAAILRVLADARAVFQERFHQPEDIGRLEVLYDLLCQPAEFIWRIPRIQIFHIERRN